MTTPTPPPAAATLDELIEALNDGINFFGDAAELSDDDAHARLAVDVLDAVAEQPVAVLAAAGERPAPSHPVAALHDGRLTARNPEHAAHHDGRIAAD